MTELRIPSARVVHCEQCGDAIDRRAGSTDTLVTAWARRFRQGGGAHGLFLPVWHERFLCRHCHDRRAAGLSWEQPQLDLGGGA